MKYVGEEIYNILPNRYPLMILDSIDIKPDSTAVGYIALTETHWFFECHYPGNPIFPGVLLIESMTQVFCSIFLAKAKIDDIPVIYKLSELSLKSGTTIGDTIRIEATLYSLRHGIAKGHCSAYKVASVDDSEDVLLTEFDIVEAIPSQMSRINR